MNLAGTLASPAGGGGRGVGGGVADLNLRASQRRHRASLPSPPPSRARSARGAGWGGGVDARRERRNLVRPIALGGGAAPPSAQPPHVSVCFSGFYCSFIPIAPPGAQMPRGRATSPVAGGEDGWPPRDRRRCVTSCFCHFWLFTCQGRGAVKTLRCGAPVFVVRGGMGRRCDAVPLRPSCLIVTFLLV